MKTLTWLPRHTIQRIEGAVDTLLETLGKRIWAILLVGAALDPARQDRGQAPELLVLMEVLELDDLRAVAKHLHDAMTFGIRVKLLTRAELQTSADVFALEVADWRDRHVLLHGRDPFVDVRVKKADLRRSVEQSLRGLNRRMRNRVLAAMATDGKRDDAQLAVAQGIERLLVIAHHAIALTGEEPPRGEQDLLEALCEHADVQPEAILGRLTSLRSGKGVGNAVDALGNVMQVASAATRWVDEL